MGVLFSCSLLSTALRLLLSIGTPTVVCFKVRINTNAINDKVSDVSRVVTSNVCFFEKDRRHKAPEKSFY